MKKCLFYKKTWLVLSGLLLMAWLTACSKDTAETKPVSTAPPSQSGEIVLPKDSPKKSYLKTVQLSLTQHPLLEPLPGKITYNESLTTRISSPVVGRVTSTPIALGTKVKTGDILLTLNSPEVASAEADYLEAQADLTLASHALHRQQELYNGKAISRKELEQAQDTLSKARGELLRAQERLRNLHINAPQHNGVFNLRSTMSGVVVERNVNPGIEVRPDLDQPLFVVSDLKKLTVLMEVFEINLSKIQIGQKLSISVPAYPGVQFPATVHYIGQVLNETTRTVEVRCELLNPDGKLLPGMFATITVQGDPSDQAIFIPLTAVFTEDEADYVFVEVAENHYQQRKIELGLRLKDHAVVNSGLQPNEQLVTEGALMLRAEAAESDDSNP